MNTKLSILSDEDAIQPRIILSQLVGKRCWRARYVNSEVLMLDIGNVQQSPLPRQPTATAGEYGLSVWSENWTVDLFDPVAETDVHDLLRHLERMIVSTDLHFADCRLVIGFELGTRLVIDPDLDAANGEEEWEDWELFLSDGAVATLCGHEWRLTAEEATTRSDGTTGS